MPDKVNKWLVTDWLRLVVKVYRKQCKAIFRITMQNLRFVSI